MTARDPDGTRQVEDGPDFADEHTRPAYEDEQTDVDVPGDEAVREDSGGSQHRDG